MFPGARGGGAEDAGLFAGLNVSVRSEIEGRFSEMDAAQKALQQQLHSIQMQMSSEVSWGAFRSHSQPGIEQRLTGCACRTRSLRLRSFARSSTS